MRVSLNTYAPLTLPGILSAAEHWDQSRDAIFLPSFLGVSHRPSRHCDQQQSSRSELSGTRPAARRRARWRGRSMDFAMIQPKRFDMN